MPVLSAENLSLSFGAFDLFTGISLNIPNDARIALIGANGIGKTSLLLILAGINQPTTGRVHFARNRRLGYLHQEAVEAFADRSNSVLAEMLTVFASLQERQAYLHELEEQMASGASDDALLQRYGEAQQAFEQAGGYDYELTIQQTLQGLGLDRTAWDLPLNHLSGGQKTRALLARLLLEKPDLLILDEPTNHLDLDAVEWLERILLEWNGAVLIVSHDRYFLDNVVNTIWEMTPSGIDEYKGNYSAYLLQRQERWEYAERVCREEKERLLKEVDFIQKNWVRASTHARALGLLRKISRELAIVENYGVLALRNGKQWMDMELRADRPLDVLTAIRKVNAISYQNPRPLRIRPRLAAERSGSTIILRARKLVAGYPGTRLFSVDELELRRGGCAALIGPNGSGKTTFLKTLLGQVQPLEGEVEMGPSVQPGYFAQAHDGLSGTHSVLEELQRHKEMDEQQARNHLAAYLFRGEDVFKSLDTLSGGERARLALALLALEGADFLVLDEPTNHLDIPAREALQEVLDEFNGTILLVSHDRYLVESLATQIWELRAKRLEVFHGGYREFVLRRAGRSPAARQTMSRPKTVLRVDGKADRQRAQSLQRLEDQIQNEETALKILYNGIQQASQEQDFTLAHELGQQAAHRQAVLEDLMWEWEKLAA